MTRRYIVLLSKKVYGYMEVHANDQAEALLEVEKRINQMPTTDGQHTEWEAHFAMGELTNENIPSGSKH